MPDPIEPAAPAPEPPQYRVYRARPRLPGRGGDGLSGLRRGRDGGGRRRARGPITPGRVIKWIVLAVVGWLLLSLVLFLLSAQFAQTRVGSDAGGELSGGGAPIVGTQTVLILGSDLRPKGSKEPGAQTSGPSRSDTMMLLRVGGGHSAKLSIPRDTIVAIPGHGRGKINSAFAYGGNALAIRTVKDFLGIKINHVVDVNFANFPGLVDAMGGIDYTGGCVVSRINGGYKNGGITLHLKAGTHHLDGKQVLALARTRENLCNRKENDFTRARRQQRILSAMKSRVLSFSGFIRLPWIAWNAPRAVETDMGAPGMVGLAASALTSGGAPTKVLPVDPATDEPLSATAVRQAVDRFLRG
ncbi:MAG TPA: LCP family protein [Solirubrobacteraceae bacterium]|nr:LCP family protein [Solirubrobacteraceae bacterium]